MLRALGVHHGSAYILSAPEAHYQKISCPVFQFGDSGDETMNLVANLFYSPMPVSAFCWSESEKKSSHHAELIKN
jgi:hypothetical protein